MKMYDDTNTKKRFLEKVLMLTERHLEEEKDEDDADSVESKFSTKDLENIKEAVGVWMEEGTSEEATKNASEDGM